MAVHTTFIVLLSCLFFQSACTSASPPVQSTMPARGDYSLMRKEISKLIKKKMKKNDVVGLSIAVVDGQKIVWTDGFGWADKKNKVKATPETVYRVGSITKLFTVTSAMQLAEQGKIDIDQPLQDVLPQFEMKSRFQNADPITLRNIMTHHSGIQANYTSGMWSEKPEDFTRLVGLLKDEYTAYPPNTIFSYSNVAMTLLGHAVQEVSGQPYDKLIEQKLLMPMGMSDSYIANKLRNDPQSSKGYSENGEAMAMPLRDIPAGGLNSTVLDLASFTKMVFAGGRSGGQQIVKTETLTEMMQFQDGDAPFDLGEQMGLGWFLEKQDGAGSGLKASHGGDTFLFHSMLTTYPRYKLGVIVLANTESAVSIVSEIADEALTLALATKTGIKRPDLKSLSDVELPATTEDLNTFPGYYSTENGVIQIIKDGDRLQLIADGDTLNLIKRQDGKYHLQYKLLGLFTIDLEGLNELGISHGEKNGLEVLLGEFHGHKMFVGEKIIPTPITTTWKSRTGSYEIINPTSGTFYKDLELDIENGFLVVRFGVQLPYQDDIAGNSQLVLQVVDDQNAIINGLGSDMGETLRVVHQDGDELLAWSGLLLRKLR